MAERDGTRFGVWNDFGRLREVAVGTTEGWLFPRTSPLYPAEDFPELTRLTEKYGCSRWRSTLPANGRPVLAQRGGHEQDD